MTSAPRLLARHLHQATAAITPATSSQSTCSAPPSPLPLPTIPPGSPHHSSLRGFLAHAASSSLSRTSPVYVGTVYEYAAARALARHGFALTRTGRAADHGIDLLGCWHVPSAPAPLPVLLQCKRHARPLGPEHVRALEGAFARAPPAWSRAGGGAPAVGFLVSPKPASRGVREAVRASAWPVGYLMVEEGEAGEACGGDLLAAAAAASTTTTTTTTVENARRDAPLGPPGRVLQFIWNDEAQQRGLEGLGVTTRYSAPSPSASAGAEEPAREIVLTWNGWAISRLPGDEAAGAQMPLDARPAAGLARGLAGTEAAEEEVPTKRKRGRPRKTVTADAADVKAEQASSPEEAAAAAIAVSTKAAAKAKEGRTRPVGQRKKT
jgi:hypothetical protein